MGFGLSDIFGGSESKSEGASVWKPQGDALEGVYDAASDVFGNNSGQLFGSQFQQPTFDAFNNLSQGGYQMPGLEENLMSFGDNQNQYLDQSIDSGLNKITQNLQRNIMPSINLGAAMNGTSGGSRQGIAQGIAMGDANQQATDFVGDMYSDNFQNTMNNNLNANNQMIGLTGQRNDAMNGAMVSAPQLSNMGFDNQYGNLNNYANIIGRPTVLGGGSTSSSSDGIMSSFGGANSAAGGLMTMLSDRRLKENIVQIGKTTGGTNLYRYNYKWSPDLHIGVMADEVDSSITVDVGGYKAVDYSKVI